MGVYVPPIDMSSRVRLCWPALCMSVPIVFALGVLALLLAALTLVASHRPVMTVAVSAAGAPAGVTVSDALVERAHGYITVLGQVRNASPHALRGGGVLVELLDARGRERGMESSLLETPSVAPGETAPFRVYLLDDGSVISCRVRYRRLVP